jgi:nucleoid DNA-binding protein
MKVVDNVLHVVKVLVRKKVLWRIENGQDVKMICFGVFKVKLKSTICPLGDAASWPAAAIRH